MADIARVVESADITDILTRYGREIIQKGATRLTNCIWHVDKHPSMAIYDDPDKQRVHCHACGAGGDVIDVVMQLEGCDLPAAMRILEGETFIAKPQVALAGKQVQPATWHTFPCNSLPNFGHRDYGTPTAVYPYHDAAGDCIGYVRRFDPVGQPKQYPPLTYGSYSTNLPPSWQSKFWPSPRPLYNLHRLAAKPKAKVLLVEGEKCADAGTRMLAGMVAMAWPGGAGAWALFDAEPLRGRIVYLCPDADLVGLEAMRRLSRRLLEHGADVWMIDSSDQPVGWDIADTDWTGTQFVAWATPRAQRQTLQGVDMAEPAQINKARAHNNPVEHGEEMPPEFSDSALAGQFSRTLGADWRYVPQWGQWIVWRGERWVRDELGASVNEARTFMNRCAASKEACNLSRSGRQQLCDRRKIKSVLDLAGTDPLHAISPSVFDADDWLLGTPGGVVDLRTGKLRPHDRGDYITKFTAATPCAGPMPYWLRAMARCTKGDPEMLAYYQKWFGYCLTGDTSEEALLVISGQQQSGKSKIIQAIAYMLGDYRRYCDIKMFMESKYDDNKYDIVELMGVRFVDTAEPGKSMRWNESLVKQMTGREPLRGRAPYEKSIVFPVKFKINMSCNDKPILQNADGMQRRLHIADFPEPLLEHEKLHNLPELLRAEWPAILQWCIEGCLLWQKERLGKPAAIMAAVDEYIENADIIGEWLEEKTERVAGARVRATEIYQSYAQFMRAGGHHPLSANRLGPELAKRGYHRTKSHGTGYIVGLKLFDVLRDAPAWVTHDD